ncbi:MAG: type II toxin-antitoxin system HicB family antitoxin [Spirochaetia bacterium]|nr:type II toxin-antitoxin system HicB family antitoxin [Spirochaetia bacterium]
MNYKGYTAIVEFDEDAEIFFGKVVDIKDIITFEASTVNDLKKEFKISIDEYLKFCEEKKQKPEKPYSGKFNVRINSDLHRRIAIKATKEHKSINDVVVEALQKVAN